MILEGRCKIYFSLFLTYNISVSMPFIFCLRLSGRPRICAEDYGQPAIIKEFQPARKELKIP